MANKGDRDDQNAANQSQPAKVKWGEVSTQNMRKCREQAEIGKYPKRRSDDEY